MSSPLTVVVDEGIAAPEWFAQHARVRSLPGRAITSRDLAEADALIVRSITRVDSRLLAGTPVRFVGSATIGTDHIDTAYLDAHGIHWVNAPGCNARAVVEYVLCALAALDLPVVGTRFGIIGAGNVGGRLWRQLEQLGAECRLYDPLLEQRDGPFASLPGVLECDVVTLHTPLTVDGPWPTTGMIGAAELAAMRSGSLLINTARGGVVDEIALRAELEAGRLCAALDVWCDEPAIDTRLLALANLATPHVAGYSREGKQNGTRAVYDAFCDCFGFRAMPMAGDAAPNPEPIDAASIGELLLRVYDPRNDDRDLRRSVMANEAGGFDRLRRDYKLRGEFANYCAPSLLPESLEWGFSASPGA